MVYEWRQHSSRMAVLVGRSTAFVWTEISQQMVPIIVIPVSFYGVQMMYLNDFGDPLYFPIVSQ